MEIFELFSNGRNLFVNWCNQVATERWVYLIIAAVYCSIYSVDTVYSLNEHLKGRENKVHVHVSTVRTTTVLVLFCKWRKRLEKWEQTTIIRKKWKLATASRTQEMSLKLKTGVRTDLSITGRHKMLFGS